ncbi:hypothetical protein IAT40_007272 [Kwoniella sp. CBS 6097]
MGSNISSSSKRGATIINDDGYYTRSYLVPDEPRSLEKIEKILSRRYFENVQVRVIPPSPVMDPQPIPGDPNLDDIPPHELDPEEESTSYTTTPPTAEDSTVPGPQAASPPSGAEAGASTGAGAGTLGRDGYIQVEFYKKGQWSSGTIEQLENALSFAKLTRIYGRPKKLAQPKTPALAPDRAVSLQEAGFVNPK